VVDGIRPPALDVAKLAAARTGQAITDRSRVETMAPVLMRDGRGVAVPVLAYADPVMQAAYAAIHNASVTQAAGRARAVMRTKDNPMEINIFGRVAPAGVVFDEIVRWQDIKPDRLEDMILADRIQLMMKYRRSLSSLPGARRGHYRRVRFTTLLLLLFSAAAAYYPRTFHPHGARDGLCSVGAAVVPNP
jgi:hypothetical protein